MIDAVSASGQILFEKLLQAGDQLDQLPWQALREGVEIHRLYGDQMTGPAAALLRYQPGARVSYHVHGGYEHILVLRGSQEDHSGVRRTGDLAICPPGSGHDILSRDGCIVLAIWSGPLTFMGE